MIVTLACSSTPASGQVETRACGVSADETRWLAESYEETHTYGLSDGSGSGGWIASYGGLAAAGDSVFLYDQLRPGVLHLSGELKERHVFGRVGEGPGEFNMPFPVTWVDNIFEGHVAFDGRNLVVYDRFDLAAFDPEGEFRWSATLPTVSLGEGVRFVSPEGGDEMMFGLDSLNAGRRRLQLWRVQRSNPNYREILWERSVPRRASAGDGPLALLGRREARSYWARHKDCVAISDGGRRLLWLVDLSTMQTDSIALPEWDVPAFGELSSDLSVMNIGGREVGARPREPALLARWTGLIVDPDGHVWLRAWTESREDFEVFVVSMASGESRRVNPPGFPTAFGPPGVFYTPREKPETDEQYVVRLASQRR
ncbi:MAG: hypothetical protein F4168_17595 [Gemmatimonadetes bacterium]|nr:hypothetical protein [Gemmatimonadota bacterium]